MVPILKKQVKNLQNEETSQNRIILPKARNAIHGIAIGNPVKIKMSQKLRNPSSDSDKSTNENSKILAPTNNLPMLQPKPVITPPPENLAEKEADPRLEMTPDEDSSLKVIGLEGLEQLIRWNMEGREYCARCNKIHNISSEAGNDPDESFHIENAVQKGHKCAVDTCGICGMNLSGDSEQLRLRHVLHCEKEKFETVRGKALYIADKEKERRNCKICGENYSNAMPTVEYSYFRRHAANHIIPDHIDGQQFYYKCFYCPERYKSKSTFVNHLFHHMQNGVHCEHCHFLSHEEGEMFIHMISHGRATCPSCNEIFLASDGYTAESLKSHWQICYTNNVEKIDTCGYCGKEFKRPNSLNDEWRMVEHLMRCGGKNDKRGTKRKDCLACGNESEFEKSVKNHALLHVLPDCSDDKPLACPIQTPCCLNQCGRVFYSRISLYQHVVGSFAKRHCPPHQNEECLNRLLERSQKTNSSEEIKNQNSKVQSRFPAFPKEAENLASMSFSASQMLQKPAESRSLQTTPVKIRRPNILRRKPKTPKKAEVKIELLESA